MAAEGPNPYKVLQYDDPKRFVCVYPAYLNTRKTIANGRRIPKCKAVDNPTSSEIRDVCSSQGLNCVLEHKHYPREQIKDQLHGGRVKVQLRQANGTPVLDSIASRRDLFVLVSEMIPKLKTRQSGKPTSTDGGGSAGGTMGGISSKKKKKRK